MPTTSARQCDHESAHNRNIARATSPVTLGIADDRSIGIRILCGLLFVLGVMSPALANEPPVTPTITEPSIDGQVLNPDDVHMETAPFSDPDVGDMHLCTNWQIYSIGDGTVVWEATCATGLEAVHAHFGDGVFVGPLAGLTQLDNDGQYILRVRHRDDSGDPATEWSAFAERPFVTGPATELFPLEGDDVIDLPGPTWQDSTGADITLAYSTDPPHLILETVAGLLLEFQPTAGGAMQIQNPPELPDHDPMRVRLGAGDLAGGLVLPESNLTFRDHEGMDHVVYLPPVNVASGEEVLFWIADSGATYMASPGQTTPDFTTLARSVPVPWRVVQPGYRVEIIASGFQLPVNIAFVPNPGPLPSDPRYYVTELYGSIKVVRNDGTVSNYASDLLNYTRTGAFPGSGEQGVTGIVVEPLTGDVIASMLYEVPSLLHYPKVVRFSSSDGGLTASSETVLLDMVGESQGQSHQISTVSIGPDGKLYVDMGDGFDASTALNLNSYRGKILRLELDGSPATDNPFYDAGDGINARDYVYVYGVRNPFGGDWRDSDGQLYEVENGPSIDRFVRTTVGSSYGWAGSDSHMFTGALYNWNPAVGPTNVQFIQPGVFGGSGFPASKFDHAFVAESGATWGTGVQSRGKRIREFVIDSGGTLTQGPIDFLEYTGVGKGTVVALAAGPDGLYFTDFYKDLDYSSPTDVGGHVLRVRYVGAADFSADVTEGLAPLAVQFSDQSTVPSPTEWNWDFGDGQTSDEQNPTHTYTEDGLYDVSLSVTGAAGVSTEQRSAFIRVGEFSRVAFLGAAVPPSGSDAALSEVLLDLGFDVDHFLDDPAQRPTASELAAEYDLVVVSSTSFSGSIAGQFRDEPIPLLTWEHALLRDDREPLAGDSGLEYGETMVDVVRNDHYITQPFSLGLLDVYDVGAGMSVGRAPFGLGSLVLATRPGVSGDAAIIVAEAGVELLSGHVSPARRVFLYFDDASYDVATAATRQIFERAAVWALGEEVSAPSFTRGDCNDDSVVDISDAVRTLSYLFQSDRGLHCIAACDANDDGSLNIADAIGLLNHLFGFDPLPEPGDCGEDPTPDALTCETSACP